MERYPAPLAKPPTIIYEKYLPAPSTPRPVIVRREICRPAAYPIIQQQIPGRHLVREVVRHIPQIQSAPQPTLVCFPQQQQQQQQPQQAIQQFVPVFAARQVIFK